MSFGISITNDSGEVVIDDTYSAFQVRDTVISTGTLSGSVYVHDLTAYAASTLRMVQIPPGGQFYGGGHSNMATSWQVATFKLMVPSYSLVAPTGYGLCVYNSAGALVYTANQDLLAIVGVGQVDNGGSPFYTNSEWFCQTSYLPMIVNVGGINKAYQQGVLRAADGASLSWISRQIGNGPPTIIPPSHVQFLHGIN